MSTPLTEETFTRALHRALHHLYDPVELRLNPLVGWLDLTRGDSPSVLRTAILDAIATLKPGPRVPEDSTAWRVYQVLCYRFEEQSSQDDVAAQMAISSRQVRRLELTAIRALSSQLTAHYGLNVPPGDQTVPAPTQPPAQLEGEVQPEHEQELDWLRKSYTPDNADVYHLVESAVKTGRPLLDRGGGSIFVELPAGLPPVTGQATTLRQILLNLLLASAAASSEPRVTITGSPVGTTIHLFFATAAGEFPHSQAADSGEYLTLARRLADLSGGSVEELHPPVQTAFLVRLILPAVKRIPVLVVDDNEDSLRLFERSLEGTRFQYTGTRDPLRTVEIAAECGAGVILLDIMLPGIDGWEILGRLRAHPWLNSVPVIISTILPHEQLALSLGAAGFLRKPVSREALLELLNRLSGD